MIYQIQRNITFTAASPGEYKFCYKKSTDTNYTCTTDGNHIVVTNVNTPETYPVTLEFDSEDCTHDYDIYVSPVCDDEKILEINALMKSPECKIYNIQRATELLLGELLIKGCNTDVYTNIPHWFIDEFRLSGGLNVCSSEPPSSANFTITLGIDCNCQCREWSVSLNSLGGCLNILYTNCIGEIVFESLAGANQSLTFCALGEVSVASEDGDAFTKVDNGPC